MQTGRRDRASLLGMVNALSRKRWLSMVRVEARELPSSGDWERLAANLTAKERVVERQADRIAWLQRENARLCRMVASGA
jgi:hypothetical protein